MLNKYKLWVCTENTTAKNPAQVLFSAGAELSPSLQTALTAGKKRQAQLKLARVYISVMHHFNLVIFIKINTFRYT